MGRAVPKGLEGGRGGEAPPYIGGGGPGGAAPRRKKRGGGRKRGGRGRLVEVPHAPIKLNYSRCICSHMNYQTKVVQTDRSTPSITHQHARNAQMHA